MPLQLDKYQLRRGETDLVVFFPYPWGGERHNNRQLLREVSLLTGGLVVGAQTPGTGKIYIDRATRRSLQAGPAFAVLAADYAGEVNAFLEASGQPRRLLAAQSGRVALGARMQLSEHRPFTHVLLRDGVNLYAPESVRQGRQRLLAQPPEGTIGYTPLPNGKPDTTQKTFFHRLRDIRARAHGLMEMLNHGELLTSTESVLAVRALARDIMTPLLHITYSEGITGTEQQQSAFGGQLQDDRVGRATSHNAEIFLAPLGTMVCRGNHADLQNPIMLSDHITWTFKLGEPGHLLPPASF